MDIGPSAAMAGLGALPAVDQQDREQAVRNSMQQLQARYGEKPKEARAVKKQLDKDDFMRIMITEMRHQDPTKPMDSDRMATQMAQITSVEQLKNVSNAIEKLSDKNSASDRLAMSGMIGRTVTVDKSRFVHQKGTLSPVNFELPEDAAKLKIVVMNEKGEDVASRDLEPMKAGTNSYNWDGVSESNTQSPSGSYMVRVEAENSKGAKIKVDSIARDRIVGVSFEGGETNFLIGDAKSPQKVAFKSVVRIESESGSPQARAPGKVAVSASDEALPPGLREKVSAEIARAGGPGEEVIEAEAPVRAEGFPNGLND